MRRKALMVVRLELREGPSRIGDRFAREAPLHVRVSVTSPAIRGSSYSATAVGIGEAAVEPGPVMQAMRAALEQGFELALEPEEDGLPAGALRRLSTRLGAP